MKKLGFLLFPLLALAVGGLAGSLSHVGIETVYPMLLKSPLTPPGTVFPIVWAVLYVLMGLGMALVVRKGGPGTTRAAIAWSLQLALNFCWSLLFFGAGQYLAALLCLALMWFMIVVMMLAFHSVSRAAAWMPDALSAVGELRRLSELHGVGYEPLTPSASLFPHFAQKGNII